MFNVLLEPYRLIEAESCEAAYSGRAGLAVVRAAFPDIQWQSTASRGPISSLRVEQHGGAQGDVWPGEH